MFGLSALATKAIGAAVIVLVIFGAGFGAGHHWEAVALEQLKAQYATEKAAAIEAARNEQNKLDNQAIEAARDEMRKQDVIVATTKSQLAQVQKNVKSLSRNCISSGVLRLYNGAILGVAPDRIPFDPGGTPEGSTSIDAVTLGSSFVANLGNCRQNTERLRSLIALLRQYQTAAKR